jgi:hypothetical protein
MGEYLLGRRVVAGTSSLLQDEEESKVPYFSPSDIKR